MWIDDDEDDNDDDGDEDDMYLQRQPTSPHWRLRSIIYMLSGVYSAYVCVCVGWGDGLGVLRRKKTQNCI